MSKISNKETKYEILVRKYLFSKGFRYRKNYNKLPGKPDIVLTKFKTVIFIHGCFWHGHDCKAGKLPSTSKLFWREKIGKNKIRDRGNETLLSERNWTVIVIWQCEIRTKPLFLKFMASLETQLK
jgi:DNA mismatch endonuclease (patch repair protein)